MTEMERLARAFAAIVRRDLADHLPAIIEKNRQLMAKHGPDTYCATPDYCDANMLMDEAFRTVMGRPVRFPCDVDDGMCTQAECDADFDLWNAAWTEAKTKEFSI